MKIALHLFVWITLVGAYSFIFKANHPSITVSVISTSFLMLGSAIAVYAKLFLNAQQLTNKLTWIQCFMIMVVVLLVTTVSVVFSIQLVYDSLVGPDPLRFSLLTNLVIDFIWIVFHLLILSWLFSLSSKKLGSIGQS